VVIYLKQEGRGIGLLNKIKAYQLQDLGLDTIEANQYLDMPVDSRDYRVAAKVNVVGRIPIVIPANRHDAGYLDVKKNKMGHLI
jgi:GTP cyclohydrolase II